MKFRSPTHRHYHFIFGHNEKFIIKLLIHLIAQWDRGEIMKVSQKRVKYNQTQLILNSLCLQKTF